MFKVNNKDTRTTPLASFWYLYCQLWTYFIPCSSVSIVKFEQVNAGWESFDQKSWRIYSLAERYRLIQKSAKKQLFSNVSALQKLPKVSNQNNVWYLCKVYNKDTRKTSIFCCNYFKLWSYSTYCPGTSIVDFKQGNPGWGIALPQFPSYSWFDINIFLRFLEKFNEILFFVKTTLWFTNFTTLWFTPANIYMFKAIIKTLEKGVKYVQSH